MGYFVGQDTRSQNPDQATICTKHKIAFPIQLMDMMKYKPRKSLFAETEPEGRSFEDSQPNTKRLIKRKKRSFLGWLKLLFLTGLVMGLLGVLSVVLLFWMWSQELPDLTSLKNYSPWRVTRVLDRNEQTAMTLAHQHRTPVPYKKIPRHLIQAIVATEDAGFFQHKGIDYTGILRAFLKNMRNWIWRSKRPKQGGSTITQQVVKTFLLSPEQTYKRKTKEAILARQLEKNLTKEEILFLYLNQIYFGCGRYGVQEAARFYFGKDVWELSIDESAILAGIPKNPERYNPKNSIRYTRLRRNYVLKRMYQTEYITQGQYNKFIQKKIQKPPRSKNNSFRYDYYTEEVRRRALTILEGLLKNKIKDKNKREDAAINWLYRGGLRIETALEPEAQKRAIKALRAGLRRVDRRLGFRGPSATVEKKDIKAFIQKLKRAALRKAREGLEEGEEEQKLYKGIVLGSHPLGFRVSIGRKKGLIPFEAMDWALRKPKKKGLALKILKRPSLQGILHRGDVVWIRPITFAELLREKIPASLSTHEPKGASLEPPFKREEQGPASQKEKSESKGSVETTSNKKTASNTALRMSKGMRQLLPWRGKIQLFSLEQMPEVQGAMVVIQPVTHRVRALVGGRDFRMSSFNRATQARRQPGSVFKPMVYGAAIESRKFTAASMVNDMFLELLVEGKTWRPQNSNRRFHNKAISLRQALTESVNTVAVRVAARVGTTKVIDFAKKLGISSPLTKHLSLALGASGVNPLEMTNAYSVFAAGGLYDKPVLITRILDHKGKVLYERLPNPKRVVSAGVSYVMTSMMRDVVRFGTGRAARSLKRPVAGKTGTSNDARNAWFVGFTPDICAGVWVGFNDRTSLGSAENGPRTALPIFIDFMKNHYLDPDGKTLPPNPFLVPEGVTFADIEPESGSRAHPESDTSKKEVFLPGTIPPFKSVQGPDLYKDPL